MARSHFELRARVVITCKSLDSGFEFVKGIAPAKKKSCSDYSIARASFSNTTATLSNPAPIVCAVGDKERSSIDPHAALGHHM